MIIFHPPKNPEEIRVAKQEDTVIICSNRRLEIIFFPILVNVEIRVILGRRECMEHYQTTKCFCKSCQLWWISYLLSWDQWSFEICINMYINHLCGETNLQEICGPSVNHKVWTPWNSESCRDGNQTNLDLAINTMLFCVCCKKIAKACWKYKESTVFAFCGAVCSLLNDSSWFFYSTKPNEKMFETCQPA